MTTFRLRNKDRLSFRLTNYVDKNRIKKPNWEKIQDFYELYAQAINETNLDINNVEDRLKISKILYNADETGIALLPRRIKVISPRGDRNVVSIFGKNREDYSTVLCCANAAGDV